MQKRKRFLTGVLAMALMVTNIVSPVGTVQAEEVTDEESSGMTEEEMEEAVATADGVDLIELPDEDGKYVVYMETGCGDEFSIKEEVQELAEEVTEVIVEADLSPERVQEFEALSNQSEAVCIEENIYLEGASTDFDPDIDIGYTDDSFLEDMDVMEMYNWKDSMIEEDMDEEDEEEEGDEWNIQMIHADGLSDEEVSEPVKVAVLDSGVEFLAGFPVEKSVNFVKDEQELTYYMNDMTGHGTAVADIIYQICPQAQIYSVKVMDENNRGRLSDIVAGIYWCIEQDVDIINMSFGTSVKSEILEKAIQAAAAQGILLVSSAGNGGTGSAVEYPAAFQEVIAVGAVDTSAEKTEESATGEEVELVAPGEQIAAKSLLGFETVNSGTSMAAPHVAGVAALLMMNSQYKDAGFIRRVLQKSSNPLGDEDFYGNGLLDAAYAKELLEEYEELVMTDQQTDTAGEGNEDVEVTAGEEDALDETVQETRPVETFEEVDYVEGRWGTSKHGALAEEMGNHYAFTATGIKLFKAGAMYADPKEHNMHPDDGSRSYWHGSKDSNYIANYIYVTRIAVAGGDMSNVMLVPGVQTETSNSTSNKKKNIYEDINENISTSKLYGRKWTTIMGEISGLSGYTGQKRWRQVFIYGLALHITTDAFAHSSFYKASDGTIKKFYHSAENSNYDKNHEADNTSHIPNRWSCARKVAKRVASHCDERVEGTVRDYSCYGESYWSGFYMCRILQYAKEVNSGYSIPKLETWFASMDYKSSK